MTKKVYNDSGLIELLEKVVEYIEKMNYSPKVNFTAFLVKGILVFLKRLS